MYTYIYIYINVFIYVYMSFYSVDFIRRTCHSDLRGVHSDVADLQVPMLEGKKCMFFCFLDRGETPGIIKWDPFWVASNIENLW